MMQSDWHPADIIAGLKKRGTSLSALSRQAGLASSTLANALTRRWPKGERLIAEALEVAPEKSGLHATVNQNTDKTNGSPDLFPALADGRSGECQ